MSLEHVKLPFLKITELPDTFTVFVGGNSREETKYTKEGETQLVLRVVLKEKDQEILEGAPPTHFLGLSNHAQVSIRRTGVLHLDELTKRYVTFKKVPVTGYKEKTIEVKSITV